MLADRVDGASRDRAGDLAGRRVRVRLHSRRECEDQPHHPAEEGETGTVAACQCGTWSVSHPCFVLFDAEVTWPLRFGDGETRTISLSARYYEPDELELLD